MTSFLKTKFRPAQNPYQMGQFDDWGSSLTSETGSSFDWSNLITKGITTGLDVYKAQQAAKAAKAEKDAIAAQAAADKAKVDAAAAKASSEAGSTGISTTTLLIAGGGLLVVLVSIFLLTKK